MKEKKLLRALGNVDNQYIKEAEPMKKTSKMLLLASYSLL